MEKKSLEEAKHIAQKVSREYPEMVIIVMDKKGKKQPTQLQNGFTESGSWMDGMW